MGARDEFGCTPQQYHAGLDKLWVALGLTEVQDEDVFTLAARKIESQREALQQSVSLAMALGWCHADDCVDLDAGRDPREKEIPDMMARARKDLAICHRVASSEVTRRNQ